MALKSKPFTIEFVGPPGAGKTTSCQSFSDLLQSKGFRVSMSQDIKDYVKELGFGGKFLLVVKFVVFRIPAVVFYIMLFTLYRICSTDSIYRYIRLTVFDLALRQLKKNKKVDVVLLDQWIIQEMWSASILKSRLNSSISKYLSKLYFHTDIILYLDIDMTTAAERIGVRGTKFSRFDRMDANRRMEELNKYNSYLFQLYQSSSCPRKYLLSGHNSPETNAQLFFQQFTSTSQVN
jgi:thymidylate kinase